MANDTRHDGGPAFPRVGEGFNNPLYDTPDMTLRDYFAAAAMQGMCASGQYWADQARSASASTEEAYAHWAYEAADHMLKARAALKGDQ